MNGMITKKTAAVAIVADSLDSGFSVIVLLSIKIDSDKKSQMIVG